MGPAGMVSWHDVSEPLLGPPHTHVRPARAARFIGASTPGEAPISYVRCVESLINERRRALNTAPNRALETALETRATGGSGCDRWGREHFRQPAPPLIPQPTPPEFPQLASPIGTNGLFGRKQFEKMVWGLGEPHDHEPRDRTDTANTPVRSRRDLGAISAQPLYAKTEPERRRAHLDQKRKELVESRMHSQAPPWAPPHGPRQSAHAPPWAPTTPTLHRWALHRWDPVGELPV